jgi:hypothetical protein
VWLGTRNSGENAAVRETEVGRQMSRAKADEGLLTYIGVLARHGRDDLSSRAGVYHTKASRTASGDNHETGGLPWPAGCCCLVVKEQTRSHKAVSFACRNVRTLRCRATMPESSSLSFLRKKGSR